MFKYIIVSGLPRFLIPAITCLLQSVYTGISTYQSCADVTNFPFIDTLNTFVSFMECNYKILFTKLFPRKRKIKPSNTNGDDKNAETDGDSDSPESGDDASSSSSSCTSSEQESNKKKSKHKKSSKRKKSKKS